MLPNKRHAYCKLFKWMKRSDKDWLFTDLKLLLS